MNPEGPRTSADGSVGMAGSPLAPGRAPLVSVMMPVYNAAAHVELALASIQAQTFTDWELIAIDDGSSDDTLTRVQSFDDPRIRVIAGQENQGLPSRLNQSIGLARGAFLARMDADDVSFPERLQVQVDFLLSRPSVDVVATDMLIIDESNRPVGREKWRGATHQEIVASPWSGFHFNHATWLGRAGWFRRFGYRVDALRTEDDDLLLRSYRSSRFHRLPQVLYAYRVEGLNLPAVWTGRRHFMKALWREARRQGTPRLVAGIPGQLVKGTAEWAADRTGILGLVSRHRSDGTVPEVLDDTFRKVLRTLSNDAPAG